MLFMFSQGGPGYDGRFGKYGEDVRRLAINQTTTNCSF